MEAAKAAYAKFKAGLYEIKAKKLKAFEKKYRREHPAVNGRGDAAKASVEAALHAHSMKLDITINKRLAQAQRKLFEHTKAQVSADTSQDSHADGVAFVAADQFSGSRPGYVFRKGQQGLGYYIDGDTRSGQNSTRVENRESSAAETREASATSTEFPYDPYDVLKKADLQYHRAMKGKNRKKERQHNIAAALSAGDQRGPAGVGDAEEAHGATNDWDAAAAGASVAWGELFSDPSLPLVLDVGCGQGKFILRFALHEAEVAAEAEQAFATARSAPVVDEDDPYAAMKQRKAEKAAQIAKEAAQARRHNFLGIEMRLGLVEQGTDACAALHHFVGEHGQLRQHAAFLHATVNTAFLAAALESYPGPVALFCVQLPDPRLKKNMKRRGTKKLIMERIVQPTLAASIAKQMIAGGLVYFSSEYLPLAKEMRSFFTFQNLFRLAPRDRVQKCRFLHAEDGSGLGFKGGILQPPSNFEQDALGGDHPTTSQSEEPQFWDGSTDSAAVEPLGDPTTNWLAENPFGCPTIREMFLHKSSRMVYRDLLECVQGSWS